MRNLFEAARVEELKQRIAHLRPDSERLWGKMNPAQALRIAAPRLGWRRGRLVRRVS
jgi:uncharacterized small protein (DUF1192 family)